MSSKSSKEDILNQLEQKAGDYEEMSGSCAQGTLLALQEQFQLGDASTLKAATVMPGIALRGETCGAVVAALMAIGLAFGRDKLDDWDGYFRALRPARRFCRSFESEFGSLMCRDVHRPLLGRTFNLADPSEAEKFAKAGAAKKCRVPAGKAARIAGELIMERENLS